jgi:predicted DNA-binding transcriptional regulator YafY
VKYAPWVVGVIAWVITAAATRVAWLGLMVGLSAGIMAVVITKKLEHRQFTAQSSHATETRQLNYGKLPIIRKGAIQRPQKLLKEIDPHTKRMRHLLSEAYMAKRCLTIRYETGNPEPGDPKVKTRDVDVYGLGEEYFDAYCHYRSEVRTFKISRVLTARLIEETFQIPPLYSPSTWVTDGWGIVEDENELT